MRHTRLKKTPLRLIALAATAALALTACGGDDDAGGDGATGTEGGGGGDLLSQLQEEGSITVGIADENPYGYVDGDGNVTGEAPEVARTILSELGIDSIEAEVVDFGALIQGLQAGQFDMIAAGMYINADRAQQINFSDPDYCVGEAFAVPEGNPKGLEDFQSVVDTPDSSIAILSGAVEEGYAADAGVPEGQIQLFGDVNQQYESLAQGRVDAVTGTYLTVKQQVESRQGLELVGPFTPKDADGNDVLGCGAFGFRPDNQEFCQAFNDELNRLQDEGELLPIITDFGFAEEDVQQAQELTVSDLTDGSAGACGSGGDGGSDSGSTETESSTE
jgi:polar amino acid transport system substrate-binding protein